MEAATGTPRHRVFVADCDLGRGLFAGCDFAAGEKILELLGPIITFADTVAMGEKEPNPLQIEKDTYIDLQEPAVFINHSCEPSTGIVDCRVLVALRDIKTGDEIRFDYSTTMEENHWTMKCRCGVASCRGVVEDFRRLHPATQKVYLTRGVVQPFIARNYSGEEMLQSG